MNTLNNHVQLIGRLGNTPEINTFGENKKKASVSIATNYYYQDKEGNKQETTTWHQLVAWGTTANYFEKYLKKGQRIMVEGRLNNRSWEDKEGVKRYITEVDVQNVLSIGSTE